MPGTVRTRQNRTDTSYQARWRPPGDGRDSERRTRTFKSRADAQQWVRDQETSFRRGHYVDPRRGTVLFADITAEWLETKEPELEPRTHSDYASSVRTWLVPERRDPLGHRSPFDTRIALITPAKIEDWLRRLADNRSHRTMVKNYGVFAQIMAFAARRGYIAANPCQSVQLPRERRAEYDPDTGDFIEDEPPAITVLSRDEISTLADAMPTAAYAMAVRFDAWMGLRASELWALKRKDIDLLHGGVHVRRAWKEVNGSHRGEAKRYFLGPLKTKAGRRYITMPEFLRDELTDYMTGISLDPDAWLFSQPDGKPVRQSAFYKKVFKPAVRRVLPHNASLRFHDLRHTAASFILAVHPNLFLVMKRLGHASMVTTTKTYGHLVGDVDAMLATALDDFAKQSTPVTVTQLAQ